MTPQRPNVGYPSRRQSRLSPEWISGFVDGEGCFHIGINKHPEVRFGYQILPELTVVQHKRDIDLLYELKKTMGCGVVRRNHGDRYCWRVRNLKNLSEIVIPFFQRYALKSSKAVEFHKFEKVVRMMHEEKHLTEEGFSKIVKIASSMNRGKERSARIKIESTPE